MGIRLYGLEDQEKTRKESEESRDIVKTIMDYGVSQNQIMYIIYDLAMNLESQPALSRITSLCKDIMKNMHEESLSIDDVLPELEL
jgi:hypothetical protein